MNNDICSKVELLVARGLQCGIASYSYLIFRNHNAVNLYLRFSSLRPDVFSTKSYKEDMRTILSIVIVIIIAFK